MFYCTFAVGFVGIYAENASVGGVEKDLAMFAIFAVLFHHCSVSTFVRKR